MKKLQSNHPEESSAQGEQQLPDYAPHKIVTYTSEELLEQVGPALTCSPSPCGIPSGPAPSGPPPTHPPKH
jgi:hypothetical protein